MKVLLDTNIVVSALLFNGTPRALLRGLYHAPFQLWTSTPLLRELLSVLRREKLRNAVESTGQTPEMIATTYASRTIIVPEAGLPSQRFAADPDDAPVVATARAAKVDWLITGDHHLLQAPDQVPCEVLTVAEALRRIGIPTDGEDS